MRRTLAAIAVAILVLVAFPTRSDAIPGIPSVCDLAPAGPIKDACELANPATAVVAGVGVVTSGVDTVTGGVASGIFDSALSWMSGILADTVKTAMDGLGAALNSAPEPPIGADWFHATYKPLMVAGIGLCFFVLLFHLFWNLVRFKTWEMVHCFKQFLAAVFLTATAPLFIRMALQFADALTQGFATWGGADAGQLNDKMTEVTSTISQFGASSVAGPVITIIVLMFAVVLVIVWMVLLALRAEILYIGTLAVPFVLPSIIDGKARFARIYTKTMFGVIIAKPILIGTFCFGAVLIANGGLSQDGIWNLVGGITIVGAATFLPLVVIKLLWPAAAPVVAVVERGAGTVVGGVKTATMVAAGAVTGGAAGAAMGAAAGSPSTPKQPPPRPRGGAT